MNLLILGSGAREHALAVKLSQSHLISRTFVAPGNGGTGTEFTNLEIDPLDFESIANAITVHQIEMVVVGPEQPLVEGLIDYFENHSDPIFQNVHFIGPNKACAALEGSKDFSKQIMEEAGIPTAKARVFTLVEWDELERYIENHPLPVVIKADGLAAGKGVAVCFDREEAIQFAASVLKDRVFGEGNSSVLVEQFLDGIEVSMFVLTDGIHYQLLPEAKDYKRIFDNDQGPNTGGMGSVSPVWFVDERFKEKVKTRIIDPLFKTLNSRGLTYKGFLFIGLMKVGNDPFVIEFNARLGDPETQSILPRIEGDLVLALLSLKSQALDQVEISVKKSAVASVVMCAENYPDSPAKGDEITFILAPDATGKIYHAGTNKRTGKLTTSGGRVLTCTAEGETLVKAISNAYQTLEQVDFRGMQYRQDIGLDVIEKRS